MLQRRIETLVLFLAALVGTAAAADDSAPVRFNRDVLPILSDNCYACHGPDAEVREADLRLDTEAGILGSDDAEGVVAPGNLDDSELWRRVSSTDPDERMPPADFTKKLTDDQIAILRRWIEQGAEWEGHWAFSPIREATPPDVDDPGGFQRNGIDAFTLRAMREHGLSPSPRAAPRTLVRRLSLDLLGLPPAPELVERFAADDGPDTYQDLVDELLESPHFGERMAMWWLDLVRYADSVGYHGDQPVSVFPYRDYVIRSFNDNKPFDRFTIEQLAGDLFDEPTREQLIASGYNRLGMMSAEGGVQPKEYLAKYIAERVRNVGGTWLGVTLGCCECHDHKYDPFTMRDFYSMEAFFADIQEKGLYSGAGNSGNWGPEIQVPTEEQSQELAQLDAEIAELKKILNTPTAALVEAQRAWERQQSPWTVLRPTEVASENGATLTLQEDGAILASGESPGMDTYTLSFAGIPAGVTAFQLEALPHDSLPSQGPGRAGNGNFVLSEFVVEAKPAEGTGVRKITLQNATATYEQTGAAGNNPYGKWAVAAAIDGDAKGENWGWAVMEQVGRANSAVFETTEDLTLGASDTLVVTLQQKHGNTSHTLGHFRLSVTNAPRPVRATEMPSPEIAAILEIAADERSDEQRSKLAAYYRGIAPLLNPVREQLQQVTQAREQLDASIATTLITVSVDPRTIRLLPRGNWMDDSGDIMQPAFPAILPHPLTGEERLNRDDLAEWLVSPGNPLTARVFVNRIWKLLFGAGLSARLEDVGAQGQAPSHPELLDWLALQFRDDWNLKELVRLIVTSGTYQQSSLPSPDAVEKDPLNVWLSHQRRFRIDAELVRDQALAVSGLLDARIGGASVFPYQPPGYWAYLNFPMRRWQNSSGSDLYRRGLYTHWQRQYLHPSLLAFDAPSREECTANRARSNTPLQALVLLNDPIYVEAARAFAIHLLESGGETDEARLETAFQRAVSRSIRPDEREVLSELLEKHRAEYRADPDAARQLLSVGESPVPEGMDQPELAAWTSVARTILNLHETITRN